MCPPPEHDALASAREPLLESEPTSPLSPLSIAPAEAPEDGATSPLSPLRTNPAEAPEDGLFRTTTITHLLEGRGAVFADKCEYDDDAEGADRLYARSSPPRGDEEVAFVSHAWQDSAYLKWLALCYRSNLVVAVVASMFRVLGAPLGAAGGARAALRFLCDCLVVWLAYAALGVVAWAGSAFCYLGIAHIGRDSPAGYWGYWFLGFLVWTSVLCEWNYRLFAEKADRRRGAPRRSVSEVWTPRPFPMPPSTDDEPGLIR